METQSVIFTSKDLPWHLRNGEKFNQTDYINKLPGVKKIIHTYEKWDITKYNPSMSIWALQTGQKIKTSQNWLEKYFLKKRKELTDDSPGFVTKYKLMWGNIYIIDVLKRNTTYHMDDLPTSEKCSCSK